MVSPGLSIILGSGHNFMASDIPESMFVAAESCPANVQTFFDEQYARMAKLAGELNIDLDYLKALSSYESALLKFGLYLDKSKI
jgi:hypothetical protein